MKVRRMAPAAQALGLGLRGPAASARGGRAGRRAALREHLGFEPAEVEHPPPLEDVELPPPRLEPPAALAPICSSDPYERATHAYGKAYRDVVRALPRPLRQPARRGRPPARRGRARARCSTGAPTAGAAAIPYGGGTSVVGGVEPRVPTATPARSRSTCGRSTACSRSTRSRAPRGSRPGATGPGARGPAARARPHAAPLPAVVRVLDARRLDRHPRRRPLRHAPHAHRRPRRVGARGHAARRVGEPPPARARAPARARTGC